MAPLSTHFSLIKLTIFDLSFHYYKGIFHLTHFFQWIILCQCALLVYIILTVLLTLNFKKIYGMNKTTCSSDPFPTRLLMSHLHAIISILQYIVKLCLTTGDFPISCKSSIVIPLIKKPSLDREMSNNYRPVSNLSFFIQSY